MRVLTRLLVASLFPFFPRSFSSLVLAVALALALFSLLCLSRSYGLRVSNGVGRSGERTRRRVVTGRDRARGAARDGVVQWQWQRWLGEAAACVGVVLGLVLRFVEECVCPGGCGREHSKSESWVPEKDQW